MSNKKLEEVFNLPPIEDLMPEDEDAEEEGKTWEDIEHEVTEYKGQMDLSERVNSALPMVEGLEQLEREMDEYANKAMSTFDDLVDLGRNVEDRHAAPIFDSASKMLQAALQAKQAKLDKKLKMVELQMRKQKLDLEEKALEHRMTRSNGEQEVQEIEGKIVGDRSTMLADIMAQLKNQDK